MFLKLYCIYVIQQGDRKSSLKMTYLVSKHVEHNNSYIYYIDYNWH